MAIAVKRESFGYFLLKKASQKGAEVFLREGVLDFEMEDSWVKVKTVSGRLYFSRLRWFLFGYKKDRFNFSILTLEKEVESSKIEELKDKMLINFDRR